MFFFFSEGFFGFPKCVLKPLLLIGLLSFTQNIQCISRVYQNWIIFLRSKERNILNHHLDWVDGISHTHICVYFLVLLSKPINQHPQISSLTTSNESKQFDLTVEGYFSVALPGNGRNGKLSLIHPNVLHVPQFTTHTIHNPSSYNVQLIPYHHFKIHHPKYVSVKVFLKQSLLFTRKLWNQFGDTIVWNYQSLKNQLFKSPVSGQPFHRFTWIPGMVCLDIQVPSLKLTTKAPEKGWLEYHRFLLGPGLFSGAMLVLGRVHLYGLRENGTTCFSPSLYSAFWFHCQLVSKSSDSEAYCVFVGFHFQKKWGKTNLALVDVPKKTSL